MIDKSRCEHYRRAIKNVADALILEHRAPVVGDAPAFPDEAIANVMLAYRHLEDASMRLGKAIQALDGGTSVYDITQVPKSAA